MGRNSPVRSIKIKNDIYVTVPSSAGLLTPYVLQEQQDWFEDEIKFLRTFIKPEMRIIDIGANYGLYTLTLSKLVGNKGRIWAFEPTADTADCLRRSIAGNALTNIELIQAGLSSRIGNEKFFTCQNSEWNSLSEIAVPGSSCETVSLLTLDHCRDKYEWKNIDFIKLDAEGEELNILRAGKDFLDSESPLIMFELKHGDKINLPLIEEFRDAGYDSYRYVPGLNILVPFNPLEPVDDFLLNLFACKKDRASSLESSGVIVPGWDHEECDPDIHVVTEYLENFPFWGILKELLDTDGSASRSFLEILSLYTMAVSSSKTADMRFNCLQTALFRLKKFLSQGEDRIERLTTFSRIAFAAGERVLGLRILGDVIYKYYDSLDFEISGPLLPGTAEYEKIDPAGNINSWLYSSLLEQFIIMHAYSTYFTQRQSLPLLLRLEQLGFISEDMLRRKKLIESVFPET